MMTRPRPQPFPVDPVLDHLDVSEAGLRVALALYMLPLGSAADLAAVLRCRPSDVTPALRELQSLAYADCVSIGWTRSRQQRWWLTEKALPHHLPLGYTWHEEWGRSALLWRLPLLESVYRVAAKVEGLGPMTGCQWWVSESSFDAVVDYQEGFMVVLWTGPLESETHIQERIGRLGPDLELRSYGAPRQPWPSLLCVVAADGWQAALAERAVRRFGFQDQVMTYCVADNTFSGVEQPRVSRGRVYELPVPIGLGGWGWDARLNASLWSQPGSMVLGRVLDAVAEWPGIWVAVAGRLIGERGKKRVQNALKTLSDLGLVERRPDGARFRYALTEKGYEILARRDRVSNDMPAKYRNVPAWTKRPQRQHHEDALMKLMGECRAERMVVANGVRSWEHLGKHGGIAPDAMLRPYRSPCCLADHSWHYVEYEMSARGPARVGAKLRGYASPRRQDHNPVLVVAWDDPAEAVFNEVGEANNLEMLTTTVSRLKEFGAVMSPGCWRYGNLIGEPVMIV